MLQWTHILNRQMDLFLMLSLDQKRIQGPVNHTHMMKLFTIIAVFKFCRVVLLLKMLDNDVRNNHQLFISSNFWSA